MNQDPVSVHALILAGGAGTRFWPASRSLRPKQLLPLLGGDPLLLETAHRVLPLCRGATTEGFPHMLIASGKHLADPTAALLADLPRRNILLEPVPRNTAPCIGWAAAVLARTEPDAVMMVLPSDHHIADVPAFREALKLAIASAASGVITTIGIRPTHPETGYGYIEVGALAGSPGAHAVTRFVEKPERAVAEQFLASGRYLWNAGMFFFRVRDMLDAIRTHLPALAEGLDAIDRAAAEGREDEAIARVFPTLPSVSIDKGVMEHMAKLAVIPGDFGWNDIGSWQSAWELAKKDDAGNSGPEGTVLVGSRDNHVVDLRSAGAKKRVIALVGIDGMVVVETDDALLIVPRDKAQDVKAVVDALKGRGDLELI